MSEWCSLDVMNDVECSSSFGGCMCVSDLRERKKGREEQGREGEESRGEGEREGRKKWEAVNKEVEEEEEEEEQV